MDSDSESEPEDFPCGDLRCPKCLDRDSMITVWIFTSVPQITFGSGLLLMDLSSSGNGTPEMER